MESFLRLMLRNSVFANMLMVLILICGVVGMLSMEKEGFPGISFDIVSISISYPGAGPEEVEEGIILKLEEVLQGIDGVKEMEFTAEEGLASGMIECIEGSDLQKIKEEVVDAIDGIIAYPKDAERAIVKVVENPNEVMKVSIWGDMNERQIREMAQDVKTELQQIVGIKRIDLLGSRNYEVSIECRESDLQRYHLSLDQVAAAISMGSVNLPGGSIKTEKEIINIRTLGRAYEKSDFESIPVRMFDDGEVLRLSDVADIKDTFAEDSVIGRFNGSRSITLDVFKGEEGDSITIVNQIRDLLDLKRKNLPKGIHLTVWGDVSELINGRIELLTKNGLIGLILVFFMLWLFMDARLSFWVGMGIPVSLLGGIAINAAMGYSINMINLFGMIMVLGIIVDDAIVVGESIYVQRVKGLGPFEAAIEGVKEMFWPVVAAVLTTVIAFVPLFFVTGIMGKFIQFVPPIVIAALLISLVEALYILPVHLRKLPDPSRKNGRRANPVTRIREGFQSLLEAFLHNIYAPSIKIALKFRYTLIALMIALTMTMVGAFKGGLMEFITFPDIDSDYLIGTVEFPDGTPLKVTEDALRKMEDAWARVDASLKEQVGEDLTRGIFTYSGMIQGFRINNGDHFGQVFVQLMPAEERNIYHKVLVNKWRETCGDILGAKLLKIDTIEHGPPGTDVEFWVMSRDVEVLEKAEKEILRALGEIDGVVEIESSKKEGKRELRLKLRDEAALYGVDLMDVARGLQDGFYGREVMRIQRGRDELKIRVRYSLDERSRFEFLNSLKIRAKRGDAVPLHHVANWHLEKGYSKIERTGGMRKIAIKANIDRTDVKLTAEGLSKELKAGVIANLMQKYKGLKIIEEGKLKDTQESNQSILFGALLSVLGIFLIIATVFKSYLQPLVVMAVIPLGLIGSVLGHLIMGMPLSMFSIFGMVALTGVVVNDSIIMMESINNRLQTGESLDVALISSGMRRFRPIVLTSLTTTSGLFPMILEKSMQAQFLIPMAVSIVFGVIFATVLTLLVVPALYLILNDIRRLCTWYISDRWLSREDVEPRY